MRNRIALAGIIALAAALILFVELNPRSKKGQSASANTSNGSPSLSVASPVSVASGGSSGKKESLQERRKRMMSNEGYRDDLKLTEQDVYMYVQAKGSNALSLVTAFESTRNKEYLKAAAEKFPDDPFVQAKALLWLEYVGGRTREMERGIQEKFSIERVRKFPGRARCS